MELLLRQVVPHGVVEVGGPPDPPPAALFKGFGESSLDFELRVWTQQPDCWMLTRSEVGVAIGAALHKAGIVIPFPQRDLHLVSVDEQAAARLHREVT